MVKKLNALKLANENFDIDAAFNISIDNDYTQLLYDMSIDNVNHLRKYELELVAGEYWYSKTVEILGVNFKLSLFGGQTTLIGKTFRMEYTTENPKTFNKKKYITEWIVTSYYNNKYYECLCLSHFERRSNGVYRYDKISLFTAETITSYLANDIKIAPTKDFIELFN